MKTFQISLQMYGLFLDNQGVEGKICIIIDLFIEEHSCTNAKSRYY